MRFPSAQAVLFARIFDKRISGREGRNSPFGDGRAIDQRVKSAIGMNKKIDTDSRAIRREIEVSTAL
jgi:hypothetical protein